ncbi:MAG: sugar phosphate nucleotidyltransferase [bacterium]|nr:sugar phosphate nucleotidyltransferase [bacterium]
MQHLGSLPARQAVAVILGGGRGTRLWPLTKYRAKPAVPLAGKYRLIDIPISNCLNSGLDRIYIFTQFNSSSLNHHISATYHLDPFSRGFVNLEAASQSNESSDWYQGTADSVRRNFKTIAQWQTPHVVILPGDTIFRMDLGRLLDFHIGHGADVTVALHPTGAERASSFGLARLDPSDRIVQMVEKPAPDRLGPLALPPAEMARWGLGPARPFLASMGIYVFRTGVLAEVCLDRTQVDFGHQILPQAVANYRVSGYVFDDYWEDIGTIRAFYEANLALASPRPPFEFYIPDAPIYTRMRFLPSTHTGRVSLRSTRISDGCRIGDAALEECVVGIRSIIGDGVRMRRTVMMGADYYEQGIPQPGFEPVPPDAPMIGIGEGCEIDRAIIDKNARVGAGARILNARGLDHHDDPGERFYIRDGIVIIPKHAIIEPGTVI